MGQNLLRVSGLRHKFVVSNFDNHVMVATCVVVFVKIHCNLFSLSLLRLVQLTGFFQRVEKKA